MDLVLAGFILVLIVTIYYLVGRSGRIHDEGSFSRTIYPTKQILVIYIFLLVVSFLNQRQTPILRSIDLVLEAPLMIDEFQVFRQPSVDEFTKTMLIGALLSGILELIYLYLLSAVISRGFSAFNGLFGDN